MPVYFDPRKRKNRRWLSARPVRIGTVLLSAWLLLTGLALLSSPQRAATPAVQQEPAITPFDSDVFGIVLESNAGSRSLSDEFMTLLANQLETYQIPYVIRVDTSIESTVDAKATGVLYQARLVVWVRDEMDYSSLMFTLVSAADTVTGDAARMRASMVPQEFAVTAGLNTDMAQLALLVKGIQHYQNHEYAPAAATFQSILNRQSGPGTALSVPVWISHLYHGNALFQQGRISDAKKDYEADLSFYSYFHQGSIAFQTGDVIRAWQMFEYGQAYDGYYTSDQLVLVHYSQGRAAERTGLYDAALASYEAALNVNARFQPALDRQAALNRLMTAQKSALSQPETTDTLDTAELYERAGQYIDLHDFASALSMTEQALRLDPSDRSAYNRLGYLYGHLGRAEEAIEAFNRSLKLEPQQAYAYMGRGYQLAAMGDMTAASIDFETAVRIDRGYAGTFIAWGLAYQMQGDIQKAGEKFWEWIQRNNRSTSQAAFIQNQAVVEISEGHAVYLTINAQAGQTLSVTAAAENPYLLDPTLVILDPSGRPIAGNDDRIINADLNAQIGGLYMPVSGTYTVVVSHAGGGSQGEATITYSLQ